MLHCAASHGDLGPGVTALDLGTGGGVLAAGCALLGCASVLALDVDPNALQLARRNLGRMGLLAGAAPPSSDGDEEEEEEESGRGCGVELVLADALALPLRGPCVDTAVLNPPFGARRPGADVEFLLAACALARGAVYSLHKAREPENVGGVRERERGEGGGWVLAATRADLE